MIGIYIILGAIAIGIGVIAYELKQIFNVLEDIDILVDFINNNIKEQ